MSDETLLPLVVRPGAWYLCAICLTCQRPIPVLLLAAPHVQVSGDGSFTFRDVPCPHCLARADYPIGAMVRLQAEQTDPNAPLRVH